MIWKGNDTENEKQNSQTPTLFSNRKKTAVETELKFESGKGNDVEKQMTWKRK